MSETLDFYPDRRWGLVFHLVLILFLLMAGIWGLWRASQSTSRPEFLLYLVPTLLAAGIVPFLLYRAYALYSAAYQLTQEVIRLRWGIRVEEIPMAVIEWVHPAHDLEPEVPLPILRWPGSILGSRSVPGGGQVEFMASRTQGLLVIATTQNRAYAISPSDPDAFLTGYARLVEYGAIKISTTESIYPSLLVTRIWRSLLARMLILTGLISGLVLLVYVVLTVQTRDQISFGISADLASGITVPAVRLLLLPVLSWIFYLLDFSSGVIFYRNQNHRYLAYLSWFIGAITPYLFLIGVFSILRVS